MPAAHHVGRRTQVLDARVGARSEKDSIDRNAFEPRTGDEAHVFERALRGLALGFRQLRGIGDTPADIGDHPGCRSPGHLGADLGSIELHLRVVARARVGAQRPPALDRALP